MPGDLTAREYRDAMALSSDPDDLSLKLRKLFPQIEERVREGGDMAPSYSDFSQITELMDIKRLYEEQEVHWRQHVAVKEEEVANLNHDLEFLRARYLLSGLFIGEGRLMEPPLEHLEPS